MLDRRSQKLSWLVAGAFVALGAAIVSADDAADDAFFEKHIRPVLVAKCLRCHGPEKASQNLRLDSPTAIAKGGDSGPALVVGRADESLILKAIQRKDDEVSAMPPDEKLPAEVVAHFVAWIKAGAKWPKAVARLEGERHWSLAALKPVALPNNSAAHPVDRFVQAQLESRQLTPTQPADKRTLIRRAAYDLTGLPPSADEVDLFLADRAPDAYERLLDRLLASPHYGEKWARHWLDVVRYADTAGETADFPTPHSWRYRNYVIAAFNSDKPYDQFLQEQLAGDILATKDSSLVPERHAELITATGYIAIARRFGFNIEKDHHLTIDDTLDIVGKSVLGLALGCARCHDHKYDPVTAADYYALYGIFASTKYASPGSEQMKTPKDMVPLGLSPEKQREAVRVGQALQKVEADLQQVSVERRAASEKWKALATQGATKLASGEISENSEGELKDAQGNPLPAIEVRPGQVVQLVILPQANHGGDSTLVEFEISAVGDSRKWNVTADVLDNFLEANPHADAQGHAGVWHFLDGRESQVLEESVKDLSGQAGLSAWRNGDTPSAFVNAANEPRKVWTTLAPRSFFMHPAQNGPVVLAWLSPIKGEVRITGRLKDAHPANGDGVAWRVEHLPGDFSLNSLAWRETHARLAQLRSQKQTLQASLPQVDVAYAVVEGQPQDAKVQLRGDPESLGDIVPRRFLSVLGGKPVTQGSGRLDLATWLTSAENPLTPRVLANRLWQHHFGVGLVRTPNDFGARGERPTHPELLDYLATELQSDWSVKRLHRLLLTSAAYQRASSGDVDPAKTDPANQWLWRFTRRRLSAEEIRDSVLAASGELDRTPGGAHPFPPENTWGYTQHTPFAAVYDHTRRSVYLMTQRIKRHPFLTLFDGADTAASTPDRYTTTVPTQALFFLNDPFVHGQSQKLTERVQLAPSDDARIDLLFRQLFSRLPSPEERSRSQQFVTDYAASLADIPEGDRPRAAWAALTRVLLGSNEFLYVD